MSGNRRREIPLSEWASREGVNLRTAQRMHHRGELPYPSKVTSSGRINLIVPESEYPAEPDLASQFFDLKRQLNRIEAKLDELLRER